MEALETGPGIRITREQNEKQVDAYHAFFSMIAHFEATKAARAKGQPEPEKVNWWDDRRQFYYGGAIRGGKSVFGLAMLLLLCKMYPGSRWHIVRRSFTQLMAIEKSLIQRLGNLPCTWRRGTKNYFVQFRNGSTIFFFSEDAKHQGTNFLGVETNGFLLEQMEELQQVTLQQAIMRAGSLYLPKMPPPAILGNFNPTYCWVKEAIYDRWVAGPENCPFHFTPALPEDNKSVTAEQYAQWGNLDEVSRQRYIKGMWDIDLKGRFFHAFHAEKHAVDDIPFNPDYPLYFSFDFNVDPACCIVFQTDKENWFHILDEVRLENADTPTVCDHLRNNWMQNEEYIRVTGDASGIARMSGIRGHLNQYHVIQRELGIPEDRFDLANTNPEIPDSRVFCNSVWARFPSVKVSRRCKYLIHDLNFVQIKRDEQGRVKIQKTGKLLNAPMNAESMGHLGDCSRYAMHTYLHKWISVPDWLKG